MTTAQTPDLLPCPFCGSAKVTAKNEHTDLSGGYYIECSACLACTGLRYACGEDPRPLLAELWNRRAELEARKPLPLSDEQIDAIADGMPGGLGGFLKTWGWRQFARKILESSDVPNAPSLLPLAGKLADAARQVVGGDVLTVGRVAPADVYCLGELCKRLRDAVDEYDAAIIESAKDKP